MDSSVRSQIEHCGWWILTDLDLSRQIRIITCMDLSNIRLVESSKKLGTIDVNDKKNAQKQGRLFDSGSWGELSDE